MTAYTFWGAIVAVMIAIIAVRAWLHPAKATAEDERKTLQPVGQQDSMIGHTAWISHDSGGDAGGGGSD